MKVVGELEKFGKTKRNKSKSRKLETFKNINIKYYIERRQKKRKERAKQKEWGEISDKKKEGKNVEMLKNTRGGKRR